MLQVSINSMEARLAQLAIDVERRQAAMEEAIRPLAELLHGKHYPAIKAIIDEIGEDINGSTAAPSESVSAGASGSSASKPRKHHTKRSSVTNDGEGAGEGDEGDGEGDEGDGEGGKDGGSDSEDTGSDSEDTGSDSACW